MCVCGTEHGELKAFKTPCENSLGTHMGVDMSMATYETQKTFRTPIVDRTRTPKKAPTKPRKNKDVKRDFQIIANIAKRNLSFDEFD